MSTFTVKITQFGGVNVSHALCPFYIPVVSLKVSMLGWVGVFVCALSKGEVCPRGMLGRFLELTSLTKRGTYVG